MTLIAVRRPHCHSEQIVKRGKAARGLQSSLGLLAPCGLTRYDIDHWSTYARHLEPDVYNPKSIRSECLSCQQMRAAPCEFHESKVGPHRLRPLARFF